MSDARISLDKAIKQTRTGDVWLFRGRSPADRAIQVTTNSPVNHVGMAVVIEDLPPLMWHAELGRGLVDMWTAARHRGAQLHDLRSAVLQWGNRYGQRAWFRQLDVQVDREMEDAILRTVARLDGTPFPTTAKLATGWLLGRTPVISGPVGEPELETAYCAEIVAVTYEAMGLLAPGRRPGWYDPGRFWSGDDLRLLRDARLGREVAVQIPKSRKAEAEAESETETESGDEPGTRPEAEADADGPAAAGEPASGAEPAPGADGPAAS